MEHVKRRTQMESDLILSIRLRDNDETILQGCEPLLGSVNRMRGPTRNRIQGDLSRKL